MTVTLVRILHERLCAPAPAAALRGCWALETDATCSQPWVLRGLEVLGREGFLPPAQSRAGGRDIPAPADRAPGEPAPVEKE